MQEIKKIEIWCDCFLLHLKVNCCQSSAKRSNGARDLKAAGQSSVIWKGADVSHNKNLSSKRVVVEMLCLSQFEDIFDVVVACKSYSFGPSWQKAQYTKLNVSVVLHIIALRFLKPGLSEPNSNILWRLESNNFIVWMATVRIFLGAVLCSSDLGVTRPVLSIYDLIQI